MEHSDDIPLVVQHHLIGNRSIALWVPDADVIKAQYRNANTSFPYWSQLWPAALALAIFLEQHTHFIHGKRILELGAGLGLPALVAAAHAASVFCSDREPAAVKAASRSANENGLENFKAGVLNWEDLPPGLDADILLLSDVNYNPASFEQLHLLVELWLQKGRTIILATPQRLMAGPFILPLLTDVRFREQSVIPHQGSPVEVTVLVLQRRP